MPRSCRFTLFAAFAVIALSAVAQDSKPPKTEEEILKSIKVPEGYEATVFAQAPGLGYPTACSAAIDGTLFVAVDENGSLDRKEKRGRIVRLRDTNGDGRADETKIFAEMDSPRGVIWDGPSGTAPGTLYVMAPPNLTAYTDTDGDGKADKQEDIVTGLGFDLKFRGADHTTNGCRMGIDGFIYVAVGDYGFTSATAKDGTTLSCRGGGIVRVRPDGTGFEIVARGQRNIYDVAISPTLDLFTRDNTNDGGGWDVRLSFVPPGAHMGYPYLFKNFPEDMVQPLADLGGGSPCGALWVDEPGLQNGLYTVEWGRNAIMYHPLTQDGASFKAEQKEWLKISRPTDMDVDASGRIYITSWDGATFTYNGPNAGYVLLVTKKDAPKVEIPDLSDSSAIPSAIISQSATLRLAGQAAFKRSGWRDQDLDALMKNVSNRDVPLAGRIAALYTAVQLTRGFGEIPESDLLQDEQLSEFAVRALGEIQTEVVIPHFGPVIALLKSPSPRVRAAAVGAMRRMAGKPLTAAATATRSEEAVKELRQRAIDEGGQGLLPHVADADPVVSHLAIRTLSELKAAQVCLNALDSADENVKPGALRALYGIYHQVVVDGLIGRLPSATGELRRGILNALCRLDNQDAPYVDPKVWWGTRPDTSGPVYQPIRWDQSDKIEAALKVALDSSNEEEGKWLVQRMYLTKVNYPGLVELMLTKAGSDTSAKLTAIAGMFRPDNSLPPEALAALQGIATNGKEAPDLRAKALRHLQKAAERSQALEFAVTSFSPLAVHDQGQPALTSAFEDFTRDGKNTKHLGAYEKLAAGNDPAKRALAQTIIVNLATSNLVKGKDKEASEKALTASWKTPESSASLLGVIARTKAKGLADEVRARLKDPNNAVAEAALFAFQSLGLNDTGAPAKQIGQMKYEEVFAAVQKGGDGAQGQDIYLRSGCIACHTIGADEPPKGPILSAVAKIYDRAALTESILKPNAKLAQGFESAWIKTRKGEQVEGFVTREGADSVDVRNIAGQTVTIEKGDIAVRGHRPQSMMPEGLLNGFTPAELANLLAYLESLKK
jgi:putative heme-binding domain-containing protein